MCHTRDKNIWGQLVQSGGKYRAGTNTGPVRLCPSLFFLLYCNACSCCQIGPNMGTNIFSHHSLGVTFGINSSLCTVPFMPFLKCPSAMPFLKCPSAMPFLNCPSRIRFLKMPFLNYFPPKDALPQNSFPKKCPSLTCPPTIPHQRQCKHCNN